MAQKQYHDDLYDICGSVYTTYDENKLFLVLL
jgi:hypothetical protein